METDTQNLTLSEEERGLVRSAIATALLLLVPLATWSAEAPVTTGEDACTEYLMDLLVNDSCNESARALCWDWIQQETTKKAALGTSTPASGSGAATATGNPLPCHIPASSGSSTAMATGMEGPYHIAASNLPLALGNQFEASIAVDPSPGNGNRMFVLGMTEPFANGLLAATSADGTSWIPSLIATAGDCPTGTLPAGRADPWAVFSEQGKLFISYIAQVGSGAVIAMSSDGGETFTCLEELFDVTTGLAADREMMAVGISVHPGAAGSLWVVYSGRSEPRTVVVRGAALDANGDPILGFCGTDTGYFCTTQVVATATQSNFVFPGGIAVGPSGEVAVSFLQNPGFFAEPVELFVAIDGDGLGPGTFTSPALPAITTQFNLPQPPNFPTVPIRPAGPLGNLAWDRLNDRLYLVTTSEDPVVTFETDIVLIRSDDPDHQVWGSPVQVNDPPSPPGVRSEFFPHIAVDQATGNVAVAWHDARNSPSNTETEAFIGISSDGGGTFANVTVSSGFSRADGDPDTSYGDYLGLDFRGRVPWMAWADNSDATMDNPDPDCFPGDPSLDIPCFDIYVPEPASSAQFVAGLIAVAGLRRHRSKRLKAN